MSGGLQSAERLLAALDQVQKLYPRIELQTLMMFLVITTRREVSKPQLETLLGMSQASAHRNLVALEKAGLVNVEKSFRGSTATPSAAGDRLMASVTAFLQKTGESNGS